MDKPSTSCVKKSNSDGEENKAVYPQKETVAPTMEIHNKIEDAKGGSIDQLPGEPVDFEFDGNSLHIIGTKNEAKRISNKFKIMQKLALLVGCGLDCHFRMARNEFRLMMMVRGVPRVLFGSTMNVIPNVKDTRKFLTAGAFIEAGQLLFFDTILDLIPQNFEGARRIIQASLTKGIEDSAIEKLYDFLKGIRHAVLTHVSTIPILWTVRDFPCKEDNESSLISVRRTIKQCGDNHLLEKEKKNPGYADSWFTEWNLGRVQTFQEMMEQKFNELP